MDVKIALAIMFLVTAEGIRIDASTKSIPDEKWQYVTVRPHAHMFWWFYGAQVKPARRESIPMVIWLQGGPGGSGTGFGNFMEIGPLDVNLKPRNSTWLKKANLLFIDNPVGTGYSYVTDENAYTKNVTQISEDLLTVLQQFFQVMAAFRNTPLYIFSESYGGKMTSVFGFRLYEAIRDGEIECRLDGVALGDSWISAVDSVTTWPMYLYQLNLLDGVALGQVDEVANATAQAVKFGQFAKATKLFGATQDVIFKLTDNVNVYNILQHNAPPFPQALYSLLGGPQKEHNQHYLRTLGVYHADPLTILMNGPIKKKLSIPVNVTWGGQSGKVLEYQSVDFMKPVVSYVSKLLNNNIQVTVYQGQLDMICDTPGAELWLRKLDWSGLNRFLSSARKPLYVPHDKRRNTAAFVKTFRPLQLYYILKAGHMVPSDAPEMALEMLTQVIDGPYGHK